MFLVAALHARVFVVTMHREQLNTFSSNITSTLLSSVDYCETGRTVRNVA